MCAIRASTAQFPRAAPATKSLRRRRGPGREYPPPLDRPRETAGRFFMSPSEGEETVSPGGICLRATARRRYPSDMSESERPTVSPGGICLRATARRRYSLAGYFMNPECALKPLSTQRTQRRKSRTRVCPLHVLRVLCASANSAARAVSQRPPSRKRRLFGPSPGGQSSGVAWPAPFADLPAPQGHHQKGSSGMRCIRSARSESLTSFLARFGSKPTSCLTILATSSGRWA